MKTEENNMAFELIITFLGAAVLLALMPGPDNIFVLTESVSKGQRNGIGVSIGLGCGVLVHTTIAATGLAFVIQQSEVTFTVIKYLGAGYLFYLAYQSFLELKATTPTLDLHSDKALPVSFFALIRKGFLMNVLNPKVSLFFIAFLPRFITEDGWNVTVQLLILGFIFMLQTVVVFSSIAILAGRLAAYVNRPEFWQITTWGKVAILSVLGLMLLL